MARRQKVDEEEHNYWMSYSDMMAALFLVFILIISFTLILSKLQYEKDNQKLEEQNVKLESQNKELMYKDKVLQEKEKELEEVIGIREKIAKSLIDRFTKKNINEDYLIIDNTTGDITLKSKILFDVDTSELNKTGKDFLRTFLPDYVDVIFEYKKYISEIIVEGHTDKDGIAGKTEDENYLYNLKLSQDRALSVVKFSIDSNSKIPFKDKSIRENLKKILTANGRAFVVPPAPNRKTGKIEKQDARRVEIKFRLIDKKMIEKMKNIIDEHKKMNKGLSSNEK